MKTLPTATSVLAKKSCTPSTTNCPLCYICKQYGSTVLYLAFGPTHSGKTTFGRKLLERLPSRDKTILVDNDAVETFVRQNFDNLRTDKEVLRSKTPESPDLRLRIPRLIVDYALAENYNVIATAGHSKRVIRAKYREIAKQNDAKVVLLIFRTSPEVVRQRFQQSGRKDISLHVNSFEELFEKQRDPVVMQPPSDEERAEYFKVFEIDEHNSEVMLDTLCEIAR